MGKAKSRAGSGQPSEAAGADDGYMLVEMVATLALTGLLLAFALPMAPSGTSSPRFLGLVAASAALLRDARSQAIEHATVVGTGFDARSRELRSGARMIRIPRDVEVTLNAGGLCPTEGEGAAQIIFRANGTNCGGVLRFARRGSVLRVRVDWIDGRIEVVQGG